VREDLREARVRATIDARAPALEDLLAPPSLAAIRAEIETSLSGASPILITGESGTGKTVLAQAIAEASGRRPVVRAVLGASDDLNTISSELFGHERGAFSGAVTKRVGLVEFAHEGALIFDEILNLPPHAQQLLLDFTQFGDFRPLGYARAEPKHADVRIIAATNGDLARAIQTGRFRADLYYRLAAVTLHLPPLRERRGDIPALAEGYLRRTDPRRPWRLSIALRRALMDPANGWPGNIRQLERAVGRARERAVTRDASADALGTEHLSPDDIGGMQARIMAPPPPSQGAEPDARAAYLRLQAERARVDALEQQVLQEAVDAHDGTVSHAARALGVARSTLISRMEAHGDMRRGGDKL